MRDIFIKCLIEEAKINKKIFLLVNDLGFNVVEEFSKKFPSQFINAGVAEQNMMGLAAGLALDGNHVFVYSIGNFPTFRCAEQIRNDVDYHKLPVTIVNVGAGVSYGNLGYSHHSLQDYSLMRAMPNTLIMSPGNGEELISSIKYVIKNPQPSYLRLAKSRSLKIKYKINTTPGKWICNYKKNKNKTFLTTGDCSTQLQILMKKKKYKDYSFYSLPLWGMRSKKKQIEQIKKFKKITVLEDHLQDGGFGSLLNETINEKKLKTKIESKYFLTEIVGKVGSMKWLSTKFYKY